MPTGSGHRRAHPMSMELANMECGEKIRLARARNRANLTLTSCVQQLLSAEGTAVAVYASRRHDAQKARLDFESARLAYEAHVTAHRCECQGQSPANDNAIKAPPAQS